MLDRLSRTLVSIAAGAALTVALAQTPVFAQAAAAKTPHVKDQGEYDLYQSISKAQTDPVKQLDLLHQWEQKYPDSDFKGQRAIMIAQAESQIAVKGVAASATPADMAAAEKAAQDLVDNVGKYLAPENKPANVSDAQWKSAEQTIAMQAHTVLGTIDMAKKTPDADAAAEKQFQAVIGMNPNDGSATYNLGSLILRERNVQRIPEGLYYIARAVQLSGPTALPPATKTAAETYLEKAYSGYHGDNSGLDDLKKASLASPTIPAGFHIDSVTDIQKKQEGDAAAFAAAHPDVAFWRTVRAALVAPDGQMYFDMIKDSEIPPDGQAFTMFNAKVVAQPSPKELLVNIDNMAGDCTLKFDMPLKGMVDPGTEFKFKGVIDSFVANPYMLTLSIDDPKTEIDGLPQTLFAPSAPHKPRARKK